ncbi:hypothetical protein AB205_0094510 [Aquarana catesbeiana]|uniref:Mitochondrial fission regulator n=3 Tax=Aquarana catesbeiana TaxID=8400 RepID=A0A2G9RUM6_AQUCT|nr:hypothetical protein AB205_0094510 [Aquarana catesbeiana]
MHRNSSVPNLKLKEEKMFSLKKPSMSLNRSTDLQDELSLLRTQIARIVVGNAGTSGSTESLPGNVDTSTPFVDYAPTFQSTTSFVISDITEEDELDVSEYSTSSIMESSFTHQRQIEANMSDDEDSVCLSKSNSFADMMGILKDIHKIKTSRDW